MTILVDQDWLGAAATQAVFAALEAAGGPGCARFVGGCVRNALIRQPVDDIDIATTLRPEATAIALRNAGLKAIPTGVGHGTITAVADGTPFEVTTLRRDVSTDGRNATVAFTDDWLEDAKRRDFRLNALYADVDGHVYDPTGQGVADAQAGHIVFVGDPETRIREDYLRILRFFRFMAWYGQGDPDVAGLAACRALAPGITRLSAERVSKELLKLLAAPHPQRAVQAMAEAGVLGRVIPEAVLNFFDAAARLSPDPVTRLMALLPPSEPILADTARRLRLSNAMRDRIVAASRALPAVHLAMQDAAARAAVYRFGQQAVADAVYWRWATDPDRSSPAQRLLSLAETWSPPKLPVGGRDVERLGVEAGPATGRLLRAFEDSWVRDDFPSSGHEQRLRALAVTLHG